MILKLFRKVGEGINPDLEVGRFLTDKTSFTQIAPVLGSLEYQSHRGAQRTLGVLHGYIPNQSDAWEYTLGILGEYFERARQRLPETPEMPTQEFVTLAQQGLPPEAREAIGLYVDSAELLGRCTAELHAALASDPRDPEFAPQRPTVLDYRALYQSMRGLAKRTVQNLRHERDSLGEDLQPAADRVVALEDELGRRLREVMEVSSSSPRFRCHGDYHLGQVLYTGHDFVIVDFEGEPGRRLPERRVKRSPLRDVAGLLRSFDYAAHTAFKQRLQEAEDGHELQGLGQWAWYWSTWVSAASLRAYLERAAELGFLHESPQETQLLLTAFLLDKALYELRYELNNRPDWVYLPLLGLLQLLGRSDHA